MEQRRTQKKNIIHIDWKQLEKNQNFGTWLNAYIRDQFIPEEQTNNRPRIKIKEYILLKEERCDKYQNRNE